MNNEITYVDGIRLFDKHEKAPDFVVCSGAITLNQLVKFCKDNASLLSEYNGEKQLKFSIQRTKKGHLTMVVDNYKKKEKSLTNDSMPF